ncbi:MAG TPA: bifunctional 2-C-methyl-D-erythritol 4-phosphate cytidylyltransferase/2-C-methyl-D-erythritol 2,4-cyclodiphosphate synthase [Micropepsaceae bacterium]|nr:bifunctional 2-C-methyl-D-erythritol 4-phosphate cytidylyltransferase/2-C-methyl-D-erythritol 2,4-cyclodiphosphate synthase [Micropepsaceae bacterium]
MKIAALIVAAGKGTRAGGALPKQFQPLAGEALLAHAWRAFAQHPAISCVAVVIGAGDQAAVAALDLTPAPLLVTGGETRQDSVRLGLEALSGDPSDAVLIHDGARPFADAALISRVIEALSHHKAVLPVLAMDDTVKRVEDGRAIETLDRNALARAQTPQGFHFAAILDAHRKFAGQAMTDDAALAEAAGLAVATVPGSPDNMKVTHPQDFSRAEAMIAARLMDVRSATGFDVHAFGPGDHVMLCGVKVPHSAGLAGHSDADVGLHALTDAVLGTIGAADIGAHFPPSDPQWRGAASSAFLAHAISLVRARGGMIAHLDVTLICERPKVGPHREAMRARIAEICALPVDRVSVKATTTERLGFTGRSEGIAAMASATVRLPWV